MITVIGYFNKGAMYLKKKSKVAFISVNLLQQVTDIIANSILTIYLLNKGLTFTNIGALWICFLGVTTIFEYPSGGFADKYGRRKIYNIGVLFTIISYILILQNKFIILIFSYALKGIGSALISGSLNAWLSVETENPSLYKSILGKAKVFDIIGILSVSIILMFVKIVNLDIYFYLIIAIEILICIISIIFMPDNYGTKESIIQIGNAGIKELLNSKELKYALILSILIYLFFTTYNFIWQPIASLVGIDTQYLLMVSALGTFASGLSSYIYSKKRDASLSRIVILLLFLYFASFIIFIFSHSFKSIILFVTGMMIFGLAKGIAFIVLSTWINSYSSESYKASVFSLIAAISSIVNIVSQYLYGKMMDNGGIIYTLMLTIILIFIAILGLVIVRTKNKDTD